MLNVWMMTLKEARLVGVLRGDVSAIRLASGAGLRAHHFYSVTLAELIKCWTT